MDVDPDAVLWMVDDNPADLEITELVCDKIGFPGRFVAFMNGQSALTALPEVWADPRARPDVILLDVNMPGLSGLSVLRLLRNDPRWSRLPVVMFSTSDNEEPIARRDGATDYLRKPNLLADTVIAIRGVIERHCKKRSEQVDCSPRA